MLNNMIGPSDAGVYLHQFVETLREELEDEYNFKIKGHLEMIRNGECRFEMHQPPANWNLMGLGVGHHYEYRIRIKVIANDLILIAIDDNNVTETICNKAEKKLSEIKSFIIQLTETFIEDNKETTGAPLTVKITSEETLERWNTNLP